MQPRMSAIGAALLLVLLGGCKLSQKEQPSDAASEAADASLAPSEVLPTSIAGFGLLPPFSPITGSLAPAPAQPGDIEGSHDTSFLKRFAGSQIIGYIVHPFDRITLYDGSSSTGPDHAAPTEGEVTRLIYRVPAGHTALEVLRNYQDVARGAGMSQINEIACVSNFSYFTGTVFDQIKFGAMTSPFSVGGAKPGNERPWCYFTAKGSVDGQPFGLAVTIAEKHLYLSGKGQDGKPIAYKDGEVVVLVDTVLAKAASNQMVMVKAADIAGALASRGTVDLYGLYFAPDTNEVKPESGPMLSEIANLLKIDLALRLEVAGHTDNSGTPEQSMASSQARANALVKALVLRYGIDPKRLLAKGYGGTFPLAPNDSAANMAKNQRVTLRKL